MSWIGGEFIINDMKEKTLKEVYSSISSAVRHNADLEEFPYMGTDIMKIKPFHKGKIYDSQEDTIALFIQTSHEAGWSVLKHRLANRVKF